MNMKDAKGHGSDPRGAHSEGVQQVGHALKGLTQEETDALRTVFAFAMGGRGHGDKLTRETRKYFDGEPSQIEHMPTVKGQLDKAISVIKGAKK